MSYKFNPFTGTFDDSGSGSSGVFSINALTGALTLVGGTGVTITPSGSNLTINATGTGANTALSNVASTSVSDDLHMQAGKTLILPNNTALRSLNNVAAPIDLIFLDAFNRMTLNGPVGSNILFQNNMIPDTPDTRSIGVLGDGLLDVFTNTLQLSQSGATLGAINFTSNDPAGNGGGSGVTLGTVGISRNLYLFTDSGTTTKQVWIESGNASAGNSGGIILRTGTATGTRGSIRILDGSEGTAGHVWTSTDTVGNGHWAAASGGGANTALSNLITTSINQDLISDATPHNLGNPTTPWGNIVGGALLISNPGAARKGNILGSATTPQGVTSAFSITNQNTQPIAIFSVNQTGIGPTSDVFINTGNTDSTFASGTIEQITGTTVNGNSGDLTLVTGNSSGTGNTGEAQLGTGQSQGSGNSGDCIAYSGDASGSGNSGALQLNSGNVDSGTSGVVSLYSGTSNTGSTGGLQVSTSGTSGAGNSGNLGVATGDTLTGTTGSIFINTGNIGDSSSTNATGNYDIRTGSNSGTGFSGDMTIQTGSVDGIGSANRSGVIYMFTGPMTDATSSGPTGEMQFITGTNSGSGDSGPITIKTGDANAAQSADVTISTGASLSDSGFIRLTAGASSGGDQGNVVISALQLQVPQTITFIGTTGAQTINKISGTVNFAGATSSLVVTCHPCTTSSIVFAVVRTNDATATIKNVIPANGSFTINLGAAATGVTSVGFLVMN